MSGRRCPLLHSMTMFMYPVTLSRMTGSSQAFLDQLGSLWGPEATKNLAIVTTHWSSYLSNEEGLREHELVNKFWQSVIEKGARHYRSGPDSPTGASQLLQKIIRDQFKGDPEQDISKLQAEVAHKLKADRGLRRAYASLRKDIAQGMGSQGFEGGTPDSRPGWFARLRGRVCM